MNIKSYQTVLLVILLLLGGCATGAKRENMVYAPYQSQSTSYGSELVSNISVTTVGGGTETNPMWVSQVSDAEFAQALMASLDIAGLLNLNQSGEYILEAHIVNIEQPLMGFDLTVTADIYYRLTDVVSSRLIYEKKLATTYTAVFSDALYGVTRLRLANEGAVRENIRFFLFDLSRLNL